MKSQNKSAVMKKTKKGGHLILKEISKPKKKKKLGKSYNWQFWADHCSANDLCICFCLYSDGWNYRCIPEIFTEKGNLRK